MHWISLIGFLIIINIYQIQSSLLKDSETEDINKDGTFQMELDIDNTDTSVSKNDIDGSTHETTSDVSLESSVAYETDERNALKYAINSGNNNYGYIHLSFIITTLMICISLCSSLNFSYINCDNQ
ncbi:unnamed protein product [Rotaria sp. Silwood2]|nr:unnamed protein product [Rotaria sp. Silwood2]CAF3042418.1 unnamed protein product [Rotaria sp. Silwood2]CAF3166495.1 unnamed protein product [Rotaria sp. Silwood2]CAF4073754.1 unnamed protein product [Rotaria sp. Silwood2]CAF4187361.1 unnamed protein product [Rotaria sp. Silwood2]